MQRDLGRDGDVGADPDEVDVDQLAAGRVALDLPGERERVVAVELQRDQRVGAVGEDVVELAGGHGDREGVAAQAVDDRGDPAGAPQPPRGA